MNVFVSMIITLLYAMLLQNLVLGSAYGISETMRIARTPKHIIMYALSVGFYCFFASCACIFADRAGLTENASLPVHIAIYTFVLCVIYLLSALFCVYILKADKKYMNSLGICAFNTLTLAVPIINFKANHTFFEAAGTSLGAAGAFVLSLLLINGGMRFLQSRNIPRVFKGTPALFIYVSLLSLMLSCLSGEALFV
mgnify:CR=1 FL=1